MVGGLDHPWDVRPIGHGRLLVTERDRARLSLVKHGRRHTIAFPSSKVWVSGETGLLGMAVDPSFKRNHRVYICQGGFRAGGGHDVHVTAWRVHVADRKVTRIQTLVSNFPTSSGRQGGCRLLVARNGALLVGTGDAAIGTNPRDLTSFGGKTLRLDRSLPGRQVPARWSSGFPTLATSGADWLPGARSSGWGAYRGTLAVAALKASRALFMKYDDAGHLRWVKVPDALTHAGRLRTVTTLANGDLLVTTDNGGGHDRILRVRPRP